MTKLATDRVPKCERLFSQGGIRIRILILVAAGMSACSFGKARETGSESDTHATSGSVKPSQTRNPTNGNTAPQFAPEPERSVSEEGQIPEAAASPTPPVLPQEQIREQRQVIMDDGVETWRIEWRGTPHVACLRWDCSCNDFMYSQRGAADLVRYRAGVSVDVLSLASIYPAHFDLPVHGTKEALLPTWPQEDADKRVTDERKLVQLVQSRDLVTVMDLQDYDHDGHATEFLLPVGGVGCAFHGFVAVGISRNRPKLHVIGTAKHPDEPLVLPRRGWQVLRPQREGTYVQYECGFRGGETQVEVELKTDRTGIHAIDFEYACPRERANVVSRVER